jgi:hypothetical protein
MNYRKSQGLKLCLLFTLFSSGCITSIDTSSSVPSKDQTNSATGARKFDAGVVFANESSHLCLPFEIIGLDPTARVLSIRTSCECVTASQTAFVGIDKRPKRGIRLSWSKESINDFSSYGPVSLDVIVDIELATPLGDGKSHSFSVSFVHTVPTVQAGV